MAYRIAAMLVALLLISGASLWGINGLHQDFGDALSGYEDLRSVYQTASHVATARTMLSSAQPDEKALAELQAASDRFQLFLSQQHHDRPVVAKAAVAAGLKQAAAQLRTDLDAPPEQRSIADDLAAIDRVYGEVMSVAGKIRKTIEQDQSDADAKRRTTFIVLGCLSAVLVAAGIVLGVVQYRSVAGPLSRLSDGVRHLASGHFAGRIAPQGHAEFVSLANDFNRMAAELDGLYRELEQKVATKSKELVRSERLASLGYLAAGVAHEINNPLGIITGYAELSLQQVQKHEDRPYAAEVEKTLRTICEEAFRCKQITEKLLSLAASRDEQRKVICLLAIAEDVVSLVGGLPAYRDRDLRLEVQEAERDRLCIQGSEAEMKQVLLNLTLNALEALEGGRGEVVLSLARRDDWVELTVQDNGRGMTPEVIERIFEPFYTVRRSGAPRGTGLGLSITHAIVHNHGGRIAAASDGMGRGSRFVVQLPAVDGFGAPSEVPFGVQALACECERQPEGWTPNGGREPRDGSARPS